MILRPCLGTPDQTCNQLGTSSRCTPHTRAWKKLRNDDRPIAKAVIAVSPRCAQCGHTGSADNPLTADHLVPLIRSGRNTGPRQTLCRDCNRAKGVS